VLLKNYRQEPSIAETCGADLIFVSMAALRADKNTSGEFE